MRSLRSDVNDDTEKWLSRHLLPVRQLAGAPDGKRRKEVLNYLSNGNQQQQPGHTSARQTCPIGSCKTNFCK